MKKLLLALLVLLLAGAAMAENNKWTRPPMKQVAVTPSDVTVYSPPLVSMFIVAAGDVVVVLTNDTVTCGTAPTFTAYPVGLFRGRIKQVCAATAATVIGYVAVP